MKGSKLYWLIGIVIGIIALLVVLSKAGLLGNDSTVKVVVESVSKHDIIETVSASGKIYPVSEMAINPDASGEITEIYVQEGDSVNKGQKLLTILTTIYSGGSSSAGSLTDALQSLGGGMPMPAMKTTQPKETKKLKTIFASMKGVVTKLQAKKGDRIGGAMQMNGMDLIRIADMSKMKVDVEIGENEILKVKKGDTAIVEVEAYPGKKIKGLVIGVSQSTSTNAMQQSLGGMADQAASYKVSIELIPATYAELIELRNGRFPFRPGMSASAEIQTTYQMQVISVPINAVTTREDEVKSEELELTPVKNEEIKEYVFVVNNKSKTELRLVKTAIQDNENIEITNGLKLGEKVIVAPFGAIARTLKKDMKVKVVTKKELFEQKSKEEE
jgi:HlyD family secretion protein